MLTLGQIHILVENLKNVTKTKTKEQEIKNFILDLTEPELLCFIMCMDSKHKIKKKIGFSNKSLLKIIIKKEYQGKTEKFYKEYGLNKAIQPIYIWRQKSIFSSKKDMDLENICDFYCMLGTITGKSSEKIKQKKIIEYVEKINKTYNYLFFAFLIGETRFGFNLDLLFKIIGVLKKIPAKTLKNNYYIFSNSEQKHRVSPFENTYNLIPGIPVKPMLCKIYTDSVFSKLIKTNDYAYEIKYDGIRIHIHIIKKEFKIYSRNQENLTKSLYEHLKFLKTIQEDIILDCELTGLNFQEITKIFRRKHKIQNFKNTVCNMKYFDILYLNKNITDVKYITRKEILKKILQKYRLEGFVEYTEYKDNFNLQQILKQTHRQGYQGLILKNINSPYEIGTRNNNWVKIKPETQTGDFVVISCTKGHGLKNNYYTSFLLGVKNGTEIQQIGYVGSGFNIEKLEQLKQKIEKIIISQENENIFLKHELIFEINFQGIQRSKIYSSGYSLRFPVFKCIRPDKNIDDINTLSQIKIINGISKK